MLEGIWNKGEYALKGSQKKVDQFEEFFYSKGMQILLNGSTFQYYFGEVGFICFLSPIHFLTAFFWIIPFKFY